MRDQLLSTFAVAFTADGKHLVIGGASGAIELVEVQTASIARRFRPEKYAVGSQRVSRRPVDRCGLLRRGWHGAARTARGVGPRIRTRRATVTPDGAPAEAAGFTTDGRLLYVTLKGQELNDGRSRDRARLQPAAGAHGIYRGSLEG